MTWFENYLFLNPPHSIDTPPVWQTSMNNFDKIFMGWKTKTVCIMNKTIHWLEPFASGSEWIFLLFLNLWCLLRSSIWLTSAFFFSLPFWDCNSLINSSFLFLLLFLHEVLYIFLPFSCDYSSKSEILTHSFLHSPRDFIYFHI